VGPTNHYIIQIHPTRRCNLRCLHCYSSSGPEERDQLPAALLLQAIADARDEGYQVSSFSGGEPILYPELPALLKHARANGMKTTVTSNGMLLDRRRLDAIAGFVNVLAISLDGIPESHNRMRANDRAFDMMQSRLEGVRASGIPFGFIFTLTQYNVNELDWAAEFAFCEGAKLFQIHPLEEVGRAANVLPGESPDAIESAYGFIESERIRKVYEGRMAVQLDLVHSQVMREHRERFVDDMDAGARPLAELVSPLVIEPTGRVAPFGYGFPDAYALGSLYSASIPELASAWRRAGWRRLQQLCRTTFDDAAAPRELPVLNWWDQLTHHAQRATIGA